MTAQVDLVTATADETRALGEALAALLAPGDVVTLSGDLGAGKTRMVQGLARGLGVTAPVTSPTFMLQRIHHGRHTLVHLDVYRLERLDDVVALGDEAFATDVVTAIEWGDTIGALLPADRVDVLLAHAEDGDALDAPVELAADGGLVDLPRTVSVTLRGRWAARHEAVAAALEAAVPPQGTA